MSAPPRMPRLRAGLALLVVALLAGCSRGPRPRPGVPPTHLVLITLEGLRADHVSALGYAPPTTAGVPDSSAREERPGFDLDALIEGGVAFARAFAPSPDPAASLAALFAGRPTPALGEAVEARLREVPHPALAELLRARGMRTLAFVSGPGKEALADGFDVFVEAENDLATVTAAWSGYTTMRNEAPDAPAFLWLHLAEAAAPFDAAPLPAQVSERDFASWYAARLEASEGESERVLAERRALAAYDAGIARTNELVRVFLERYAHGRRDDQEERWVLDDERGPHWSETLVVGCGVDGVLLGEECDAFGPTAALRDATLHVPLFLHHPASLTGRRIFADVIELSDVAPTLYEWFGVERPPSASGRSLLAITDSGHGSEFPAWPAFGARGAGSYTLRTTSHRLVWQPADDAALCEVRALRFFAGDAAFERELELERVDPALERDLVARLRERVEQEIGPAAGAVLARR